MYNCNSSRAWYRFITPATIITFMRIVLTPIVAYCIAMHCWRLSLTLLVIAGLSDGLDGFVARFCGHETTFGRLFDPIADKFLLLSSFSALAYTGPEHLAIPHWFVWLLIARESCILLGSLILLIHTRFSRGTQSYDAIAPTRWGKMATCVQLLFVGWLLLCYLFGWVPIRTYIIGFAGVVLFAVISFIQYAGIWLISLKRGA